MSEENKEVVTPPANNTEIEQLRESVKKLEAKLCCKFKPASFSNAPKAMKQAAKGIAGLLTPMLAFSPLRKIFELIIHPGIIFPHLDFLKDHHLYLQ